MKKKVFFVILAALALTSGNVAAAVEIGLGVVTKPGSAQNIAAEKFKELIEGRSGGAVRVQIHHSASLGDETEILRKIQKNSVQMGIITSGVFDSFSPVARVIDFPFIFRDSAQADRILDGPLGAELLKGLETAGFKGLCFSENGFRNLTNSRRPVKIPADLRGLKIRVMDSELHKTVWQKLGAEAVPMPWPIYDELARDAVDGQENPLWVLEVYKFYQVQKYLSLTRHVYSSHIDVASLAWWKTLDAGLRDMIQKAMYEAALFERRDNRSKEAAILRLVGEKGMELQTNLDIEAFRFRMAGLQDMALFQAPEVRGLLTKFLRAAR